MHPKIAAALCLAILPFATHAADPALYRLAIADVPVENGKILDMEFHETARDDHASTVRIVRRSGGSVSSSMFILRGMCGLMRARGKENVVPERLPGDGERFTVTFPDAPPEAGKGFTKAQCDLMHY